MSVLAETFTLANGIKIPKIGLGTWQIANDEVISPVAAALKNKYTHIDSAFGYQNEQGVGQAIRESGIARNELFVTTKIPAEVKTYEGAQEHIAKSLANLDLGYIDLLLIHAPKPWPKMWKSDDPYFSENAAVWKAMEEAYQAGKVKSIGVSNFDVADLENLLNHCEIKPLVNQIRYHIGWTQDEIVAFCNKHGILVQGYSPIATGRLLNNEKVAEIAKKYHVSIAQLCIKYVLQNNILPLPKSVNAERIVQNTQLDFTISEEDMDYLNSIKE